MARYTNLLLYTYVLLCCGYLSISGQHTASLPHCKQNGNRKDLVLVSTLDGFLTAIDSTGTVFWHVETGPGPLLSSSFHKLELTNQGQWVRIIPSLSGSLYKFDGVTIDAIPISAESLLTSSFRYSDDLLIAGGQEVRTYGIHLDTGIPIYECSLEGCKNTTENESDLNEVIIVERKTHIVRAVEPRTGNERWNFSVGLHNVKVPFVSCIDTNLQPESFNISAVLPLGLLTANNLEKPSEILWQKKFDAPIVSVWRWNGRELKSLNLFKPVVSNVETDNDPSLYVAMHNKQLYVHESKKMLNLLGVKLHSSDMHSVIESRSLTQIPWNPMPASGGIDEMDDSTALSVLYGTDYIDGNGYYLYMHEEPTICKSNFSQIVNIEKLKTSSIWSWWKEVLLMAAATVLISNLIYVNHKYFEFYKTPVSQPVQPVLPIFQPVHSVLPMVKPDQPILPMEEPKFGNISVERSLSESSDTVFESKYTSEFEHVSCLGKGGFGVVFQARKKFDECEYAVKRIRLPNNSSAKQRMMREVKVLAKLDHLNIVRYYNAWLEHPPHGWQIINDMEWKKDCSLSFTEPSEVSNDDVSAAKKLESESSQGSCIVFQNNFSSQGSSSDSSIVFQKKSQESFSIVFENSTSSRECSTEHSSILDDTVSKKEAVESDTAPIYLYIQMQLCCKESLKDWLNNNPTRDDKFLILDIFQQIIQAVEYVHLKGLIHRDLKPSNILFSLEGQVKVGDFGLVTTITDYVDSDYDEDGDNETRKSYTRNVGTQVYMSPEQLSGQQYNHKVDIYSLGIIFFELLVPFQTEMERFKILTDLRKNIYPEDFYQLHSKHYDLLNSMLSINPVCRPTASEIRAKLNA